MTEEDRSNSGTAAPASPQTESQSDQPSDVGPVSEHSQISGTEVAPVIAQRQDTDSGQGRSSTIDPDIYRLVWLLLKGWWIILIVVALSVVYAGYSLTKHGPTYTAHMLVREIDTRAGGIQLPSRLTNLPQGFGVAIDKKKSTSFDHFTVLLGSVQFAEKLDTKFGYVKSVYAGQWNAETESWIAPSGWRTDLDDYFRDFAPIADWSPPNAQQLAAYVAASINIVDIQGQPDIHRIQYQHPNPEFALEFLRNVFQEAESELYGQELGRVEKMMSYVRNKLSKITISEYRDSLLFVLAGQEKRMLELQSGTPYVAEIIQPPVVSDKASSPNVLVRLILGAIVGLALGGVFVLVLAFLKAVLVRRPSRRAQ